MDKTRPCPSCEYILKDCDKPNSVVVCQSCGGGFSTNYLAIIPVNTPIKPWPTGEFTVWGEPVIYTLAHSYFYEKYEESD